jgi:formamidopyrimidine-DNA glycosylase
MPELPEIVSYLEALDERIVGQPVEAVRLASPSLLRTHAPPLSAVAGREVRATRRLGKRIVLELDGALYLVLHLMIAGRLRWRARGAAVPRRVGHAAFDFPTGTLIVTEAGTVKRASLHVVEGESGLAAHDRGGVEPLETTPAAVRAALLRENRTVKRALTDPRLVSGIGNAHSDEILWEACVSPVKLTRRLTEGELARLVEAMRSSLTRWTGILRRERAGGPIVVTAAREGLAADVGGARGTGRMTMDRRVKVPPVIIVLIAAALMWAASQLLPFGRSVRPAASIAAVVIAGLGGVIAIAGVLEFRRAATTVNPLDPAKASTLVTGGVYRFTRNPMYLGLALVLVAFGLWLGSWPSLFVVTGYIAWLGRFQIEPEERALEQKFGGAYAAYARRVRRWV